MNRSFARRPSSTRDSTLLTTTALVFSLLAGCATSKPKPVLESMLETEALDRRPATLDELIQVLKRQLARTMIRSGQGVEKIAATGGFRLASSSYGKIVQDTEDYVEQKILAYLREKDAAIAFQNVPGLSGLKFDQFKSLADLEKQLNRIASAQKESSTAHLQKAIVREFLSSGYLHHALNLDPRLSRIVGESVLGKDFLATLKAQGQLQANNTKSNAPWLASQLEPKVQSNAYSVIAIQGDVRDAYTLKGVRGAETVNIETYLSFKLMNQRIVNRSNERVFRTVISFDQNNGVSLLAANYKDNLSGFAKEIVEKQQKDVQEFLTAQLKDRAGAEMRTHSAIRTEASWDDIQRYMINHPEDALEALEKYARKANNTSILLNYAEGYIGSQRGVAESMNRSVNRLRALANDRAFASKGNQFIIITDDIDELHSQVSKQNSLGTVRVVPPNYQERLRIVQESIENSPALKAKLKDITAKDVAMNFSGLNYSQIQQNLAEMAATRGYVSIKMLKNIAITELEQKYGKLLTWMRPTNLKFSMFEGDDKLSDETAKMLRRLLKGMVDDPKKAQVLSLMVAGPGAGKTALLKAAVQEFPEFIFAELGDIMDMYLGNSEKNLRKLKQLFRETDRPIVIFIDEIHLVLNDSSSSVGNEAYKEKTKALLELLSDNSLRGKVHFAGATGYPGSIGEHFWSRLDSARAIAFWEYPKTAAQKRAMYTTFFKLYDYDFDAAQLSDEFLDRIPNFSQRYMEGNVTNLPNMKNIAQVEDLKKRMVKFYDTMPNDAPEWFKVPDWYIQDKTGSTITQRDMVEYMLSTQIETTRTNEFDLSILKVISTISDMEKRPPKYRFWKKAQFESEMDRIRSQMNGEELEELKKLENKEVPGLDKLLDRMEKEGQEQ